MSVQNTIFSAICCSIDELRLVCVGVNSPHIITHHVGNLNFFVTDCKTFLKMVTVNCVVYILARSVIVLFPHLYI